MTMPACVRPAEVCVAPSEVSAPTSLARPKSRTLPRPSVVTITLAGFRGQRLGQRAGNLDDAFDWQAIRRDQPIQRLPLDQFHGEKVDAVGFFHRVQRYNIRMVECGDRASLALEPGQSFGS